MLFRKKNLKKIQKQRERNQEKGMTNNESKAKKTKLNETLDLGIIDTQYHLHCPSPSQFGEADINHNIKVFIFFT